MCPYETVQTSRIHDFTSRIFGKYDVTRMGHKAQEYTKNWKGDSYLPVLRGYLTQLCIVEIL